MSLNKITPFLWFDNNGQEAAEFYVSVFPNSRIITSSPFITVFELENQRMQALNGGPNFEFTEAISWYVDCEDQAEVDYYWDKLISNGGTPGQCGWLKDKYGMSWQIVPKALPKLMMDSDPIKAGKVREAMMKMTKIMVQDLEEAYGQE
jgi:predicted 3-demethylubiquinone-9 3-methyltransferase (glyoxalase superfamily)